MKASRILFALIILVLLFTTIAPTPATAAPSGNSVLTITNKTAGPITITLDGPKSYTITAAPGVTTKEVVRGKYEYEYKACGVAKKADLAANGGKSKLNIAACKMAKIVFMNYTTGTLKVNLTGPMNKKVSVPANSWQLVEVYKGEYKWTGTWCNQTKDGTITLAGKKRWSFWGC